MNFLRVLRILGMTAGLTGLSILSRQVSLARSGESPPGLAAALGCLSVLFLVRAAVTEKVRGPDANLEKDVLWGLALGVALAALLLLRGV